MGMFDYIKYKMDCPKCGKVVDDFQSKDNVRCLETINFWEVSNFYTMCQKCEVWIEFTLKFKSKPNRKITIKDYSMVVGDDKK